MHVIFILLVVWIAVTIALRLARAIVNGLVTLAAIAVFVVVGIVRMVLAK